MERVSKAQLDFPSSRPDLVYPARVLRSDFPKHPKVTADGGYQDMWRRFDAWAAESLSAAETEALAGGTCARLFGFDGAAAHPRI